MYYVSYFLHEGSSDMRLAVLVLTFVLGAGQYIQAGFLTQFLETFDGPDLPNSLNYITEPNSNRWFIDSSQRLFGEKFADVVAIRAAISVDQFNLPAEGELRYSVDMGRPSGTVPGGTGVGLIFGNYLVILHPGFPKDTDGAPGAFRLETFTLDGNSISRQALTQNQDIGFIPLLDDIHHVEAVVAKQNGGLSIDVTVTGFGPATFPGCKRLDCPDLLAPDFHTYNFSYFDPISRLGDGQIGVFISRLNPPGTSDGYFDNLHVESSVVPEPSSIVLLGIGVLGIAVLVRRRTANSSSVRQVSAESAKLYP